MIFHLFVNAFNKVASFCVDPTPIAAYYSASRVRIMNSL